jgi:FMN-dependent NADH-azoreductase
MKLLHVDSSILGPHSASRLLTSALVDKWRERVSGLEVTTVDLSKEPLGHLSDWQVATRFAPLESPTAAQQAELETSERALTQFLEADVVIIGAPMYNFSVPSQLKAWIDRIAVAGRTFRYGANGPEGLAGGKKVIIVSSRGGVYAAGTAMEPYDFQEKYLTALFSFLGVTDLEFIRAEGLAMSEHKEKSIEAAKQAILAA